MIKELFIVAQQIHIEGLPQVSADNTTLLRVFSLALAVAGAMAVLFILIGAGRYATSGGDPGQTKRARDTLLYSIIGLIISGSAFFVVQFVLGSLNNP